MTDQQYHYYRFYDWHRKSALYKYNMYLNIKQKIKDAIHIGIDPRTDPEYKQYWVLIDEDTQKIFESEILGKNLTFEDASVPNDEKEKKSDQ